MKISNISLKHKYKLTMVEWEDSVLGFQGWKFIKEQSRKLTRFISVGFLVYEDKNCVILFPHIDNSKKGKNKTGSGDIIIPKKSIRKLKTLI